MYWFSIIILIFAGAWISVAIGFAFQAEKTTALKYWLRIVGVCIMVLGAVGFFGSALSACGGLSWLGRSFEWPVGSAENVLEMPNHDYVVPVVAPARIQVYGPDWKFLRGWFVAGGVLHMRISGTNNIEVLAKGEVRYIYGIDGSLLSQGTYTVEYYNAFLESGLTMTVPTPWWLWEFEGPFHSWLFMVIGMLMVALAEKMKFGRPNARP